MRVGRAGVLSAVGKKRQIELKNNQASSQQSEARGGRPQTAEQYEELGKKYEKYLQRPESAARQDIQT